MRLELACVLSLSLWPWKKPVGTTVRPVPVLPKISKPPYVSVALLNSGSTQVESTPDAVRRLAAWQADSPSSSGVSNIVVFQLLAAIASSFALGIACAGRKPKNRVWSAADTLPHGSGLPQTCKNLRLPLRRETVFGVHVQIRVTGSIRERGELRPGGLKSRLGSWGKARDALPNARGIAPSDTRPSNLN